MAMERYAAVEHREAEINNAVENEVNELLEKYQDELACLAQSKSAAFETVQSYCLSNKETLFGKRRSIGTLHAVAGFRLGTPRLKTAKSANWNKVLGELKEKLPAYVRTVEEPAKDLLLADRQKEHVAPLLVQMGIEVVQDELFYIETKKRHNYFKKVFMKTRRELKHEMLLTFIANARSAKQKNRKTPAKPKFLGTLLSFFL
jgi:phage host-nuclease inhibitor protein Gam